MGQALPRPKHLPLS